MSTSGACSVDRGAVRVCEQHRFQICAVLKNFAVVYEDAESGVSLAPAYDLICTTVYQPNDSLALTVNGSKAFPGVKGIEMFARRHCDVSAARVKKLLQGIAHGVAQAS